MNGLFRRSSLPALGVIVLVCVATAQVADTPPAELDLEAACATKACHPDIIETEYVHGPVAANECTACHESEENQHEFTLAYEGVELCQACHGEYEGEARHEPADDDCMSCHSPHGGDEKALLMAPPADLCAMCHDDITTLADEATFKHSSIFEGESCVTCHSPHAGDFPKLLSGDPMQICLDCHDKKIKVDKRSIVDVKKEIAGKKFLHGPIREKSCLGCHEVHGSKFTSMLNAQYPEKLYAPFTPQTYAVCFKCHDKNLALEAQTTKATKFRNGPQNLHNLHVHKKVKGRSCRACHAAHASDQPHQISASVPFGPGDWSIPIRFKTSETGGTCASGCHLPRDYDRETPVDYGLD